MNQKNKNDNLAKLAYWGAVIYLITVVVAIIWGQMQSSKPYNNDGSLVVPIFFFAGTSLSAFIFGYALVHNSKRTIFIPAFCIASITALAGLAAISFLQSLSNWQF